MNRILHGCTRPVKVSDRAYGIANWLIHHYEIQPGFGLAFYLNVCPNINNFDAVRLWVELQIQIRPPMFETLGDLRQAFAARLPINNVA